jgi:hypothetical protein
VKFGPQYKYFPEPGKSYYICKAEDEDTARVKPLKALASTSTTREGSATSAASLGAL